MAEFQVEQHHIPQLRQAVAETNRRYQTYLATQQAENARRAPHHPYCMETCLPGVVTDLLFLCPAWDQSPAQRVKRPPPVLLIPADRKNILARRTARPIKCLVRLSS